jgi:hypothetical protein
MSFTDSLENLLLNHFFGKADYTHPAALHVGLSTTTPTDAGGTFTEPAVGAYARAVTAPSDWASSTAGVTTNAAPIIFPNCTVDWGTVTHFGIFDGAGATPLATGALSPAKAIVAGDTPDFAVGALKVYLD